VGVRDRRTATTVAAVPPRSGVESERAPARDITVHDE